MLIRGEDNAPGFGAGESAMPFDTPTDRRTGRRAAGPSAPRPPRADDLGPCVTHAPAPLMLWRDIHLALVETGQTIAPEQMAAFAMVRRDETGALRAALAGEVVLEALHVSHLWVDEFFRGQGLGGQLMDLAEAHGRKNGARRCHLETRSEDARRFYERRGYRICGEMKNYLGAQSLYFMEKPLD